MEKPREKQGFFGLSHRFFLTALWRPGARDFFFYTLAMRSTVSAGIPLLSAFEIMAKSVKHRRLQQASRDIGRAVSAGVPLEKAMRLHKDVFSPFFLNVFFSGVRSGSLPDCLDILVQHYSGLMKLRGKILEVILYP